MLAAEASPVIYVTAADRRRLSGLIGAGGGGPPGAALLADELERAVVVEPGELPERFVRLGSHVRYEEPGRGGVRTVQLVLPADADIDAGRISVFTPVGAALLGLRPGCIFSWRTAGAERTLRILEVDDDDHLD